MKKIVLRPLRDFVLLCSALTLAACSSKTCIDTGIAGSYVLKSNGIDYALQLNPQGVGSLAVAGENLGQLKWKLENLDDQYQAVALETSGKVAEAMNKLLAFGKAQPDKTTVATEPTLTLMAAECGKDGDSGRLVISADDRVWFIRRK